jgi:diguanylate cyclase
VAARVRGALREADFVARFGGEEFVMLLPETDAAQAAQAMETVRRAINARGVNYANGSSLTVTASFGVAAFAEGDTSERVFTRADAALYQAKSSGRDRVQVYGTADVPPG